MNKGPASRFLGGFVGSPGDSGRWSYLVAYRVWLIYAASNQTEPLISSPAGRGEGPVTASLMEHVQVGTRPKRERPCSESSLDLKVYFRKQLGCAAFLGPALTLTRSSALNPRGPHI